MFDRLLLISGSIVFLLINPAFSAEMERHEPKRSLAMVLAKPTVTREVGPAKEGNEKYSFSSIFEVELSDIKLVFGDVDKKKILVRLTANHREVFRKAKTINVLLNITDETVNALYWSHPYVVACVPKDMLEGSQESSLFYLFEEQDNRERRRVCIDAAFVDR